MRCRHFARPTQYSIPLRRAAIQSRALVQSRLPVTPDSWHIPAHLSCCKHVAVHSWGPPKACSPTETPTSAYDVRVAQGVDSERWESEAAGRELGKRPIVCCPAVALRRLVSSAGEIDVPALHVSADELDLQPVAHI